MGIGIGARDVIATRMAGYATFIGGAMVMGVVALAFALAPAQIARLITNQENVIAASIPLMMVAAVFQLSDGIQAVGAGVLRGAADTSTRSTRTWSGTGLIGLGIVGLWWGLCVGLTVVAVLLFVRFERCRGESSRHWRIDSGRHTP